MVDLLHQLPGGRGEVPPGQDLPPGRHGHGDGLQPNGPHGQDGWTGRRDGLRGRANRLRQGLANRLRRRAANQPQHGRRHAGQDRFLPPLLAGRLDPLNTLGPCADQRRLEPHGLRGVADAAQGLILRQRLTAGRPGLHEISAGAELT